MFLTLFHNHVVIKSINRIINPFRPSLNYYSACNQFQPAFGSVPSSQLFSLGLYKSFANSAALQLPTSLHKDFFPSFFFFFEFPFVPLVVMVCRDISHSWLNFTWACVERRGGLSKESPAPLILPPPQRWKTKQKQKGTAFLLSILISLFGEPSELG